MNVLLVGLGGFIGAITRYALSGLAQRIVQRWTSSGFPLGTLVVNTLGCLVIGFVAWLVVDRQAMSDHARLLVSVGFLGSLTTFSAFSYESFALIKDGTWWLAISSIVANVVLGLLAVLGGWQGAKSLLGN